MADPLGNEAWKWRAVRETVEGQQSPSSCALTDGRVIFSARPIPKGAQPNLKFLSQILRSDEPLPPVAREWLADLFDPDAESDYQIKTLARRRRGAKQVGISNNWDAARYALERMDCGDQADDPQARDDRADTWEVAIMVAAEKFRISESAVEAAVKSYREAKEIHDQIV
ncbi:hypothetical protein [Sphingobium estronivorans]|uniref:hypothetical protein n=1 Tax=Sphingobium estronivorans TaxID=1577690 RepID=UPI001239BFBB|nr:hypothetical protein [Sphingobium estronivorans]